MVSLACWAAGQGRPPGIYRRRQRAAGDSASRLVQEFDELIQERTLSQKILGFSISFSTWPWFLRISSRSMMPSLRSIHVTG
jgi:hypothetical protein